MVLEACVTTLQQALAAQQQGADRIELCVNLEVDGLTPPEELIRDVKAALDIPMMVMIHPRAGEYRYTAAELQEIKDSIDVCKEIGVQGIVIGAVTEQQSLDIAVIKELVEYAQPLEVTIHKAIDVVADPLADLEKLLAIPSIRRVLTSGQQPTAWEGRELIKKMMKVGGDQITILVGGRVTNENINQLHQEIHAKEYHGRKVVGALE